MAAPERSSRIPGLYKLSVRERLNKVKEFAGLTEDEAEVLLGSDPATLAMADKMIENVVGVFQFPIGFAANFRIDDRDVLVPLVIEEPSVVAACSNAAKLMRDGPGIITTASEQLMTGQIQICHMPSSAEAKRAIEAEATRLVGLANASQPRLVERGGGARRLIVREFPDTLIGPMLVVHLVVDVRDAMGANLINQMCEELSFECASLSRGEINLRILSNLADERLSTGVGRVPLELLDRKELGLTGAEVANRIVQASIFAEVDPYRAATHNKGIMNGVDAFLLATGQDWRAVEAGAHAFAARGKGYTAMATWRRIGDDLVGRITLPMQVGIVGGVTKTHPAVKVLLKVVEAKQASDLGRIACAVGLAQNLAAVMALATEGIQRGHMSLHARNIATAAGAKDSAEVDRVVKEMIARRTFTHAAAESLITAKDEARSRTSREVGDLRNTHWPAIEELLREMIGVDDRAGSFPDMAWYHLGTGGKRLRATLPLAIYQALGGNPGEVVPMAATMELLHNAAIIYHDTATLAPSRRGQEPVWLRYGQNLAVSLAGGLSFEALRCLERLELPATQVRRLQAMVVLHLRTFLRAQIDNQRLFSTGLGSAETRLDLIRDSITSLFTVSVTGAALLAGARPTMLERLEVVSGHLGVVFQVQDELLDILGGEYQPRGAAIADGRMGLLLAHCLRTAPQGEAEELRRILNKRRADTLPEDINHAIRFMDRHGSLRYGVDLINVHQAEIHSLAKEMPEPMLALLDGLTDVFLAPLVARVGL
jgi:hydroxymethylglutaryl-CoA reductase